MSLAERASSSLLQRRTEIVAPAVPRLTDLEVVGGRGSWLQTSDGRRILDLATGIAVLPLGHSHPVVVAAIRKAAGALQHVCAHLATYPGYVGVCEALGRLVPHGERTRAMLVNSGAEAVENAVKIARQATGRSGVLAFTEAFHGRTLLGMSLTGKTATRRGCGPFAPGVYRLPYPNRRLYGDGLDEAAFVERELDRLERAFVTTVDADDLACVVLEVVQGEGGMVPCPPGWLRGLRRICDERGVLLVADEVQSGIGRAGAWAAWQRTGVTPDLSTFAKALGGGLPLGAVVGRAEVVEAAAPGTIGGTFGGNPVACAASLATMKVVESDGLCARADEIGELVSERFRGRAGILDERGMGAMRAIEVGPGRAGEVCRRALDAGVLLIPAGARGEAVRLLPPLNISREDLGFGLDVLAASLDG